MEREVTVEISTLGLMAAQLMGKLLAVKRFHGQCTRPNVHVVHSAAGDLISCHNPPSWAVGAGLDLGSGSSSC